MGESRRRCLELQEKEKVGIGSLVERAFHQLDTRIYRTAQWIIWVLISVSVLLFMIDFLFGSDYPGKELVGRLDRIILWIFVVEIALRIISFHPPKLDVFVGLSLIHISEPTRLVHSSRMPSSA